MVQSGYCSRPKLEGKQKGRGKMREKIGTETTSFKAKSTRGISATIATTLDMAKKTRGFLTVGADRACTNRKK